MLHYITYYITAILNVDFILFNLELQFDTLTF